MRALFHLRGSRPLGLDPGFSLSFRLPPLPLPLMTASGPRPQRLHQRNWAARPANSAAAPSAIPRTGLDDSWRASNRRTSGTDPRRETDRLLRRLGHSPSSQRSVFLLGGLAIAAALLASSAASPHAGALRFWRCRGLTWLKLQATCNAMARID